MKQVIVLRTDLKLGKGKLIAQACHACLGALKLASKDVVEKWEKEGSKKVVVKVKSKKELLDVYEKAKEKGIPCFLVRDAGLTQVEPGTLTAVALGPDEDEKIDEITGKLKLL